MLGTSSVLQRRKNLLEKVNTLTVDVDSSLEESRNEFLRSHTTTAVPTGCGLMSETSVSTLGSVSDTKSFVRGSSSTPKHWLAGLDTLPLRITPTGLQPVGMLDFGEDGRRSVGTPSAANSEPPRSLRAPLEMNMIDTNYETVTPSSMFSGTPMFPSTPTSLPWADDTLDPSSYSALYSSTMNAAEEEEDEEEKESEESENEGRESEEQDDDGSDGVDGADVASYAQFPQDEELTNGDLSAANIQTDWALAAQSAAASQSVLLYQRMTQLQQLQQLHQMHQQHYQLHAMHLQQQLLQLQQYQQYNPYEPLDPFGTGVMSQNAPDSNDPTRWSASVSHGAGALDANPTHAHQRPEGAMGSRESGATESRRRQHPSTLYYTANGEESGVDYVGACEAVFGVSVSTAAKEKDEREEKRQSQALLPDYTAVTDEKNVHAFLEYCENYPEESEYVRPKTAMPSVGARRKRAVRTKKQTTIMLRNIPNKYTQAELLKVMEKQGFPTTKFNFLYLPIDFRQRCNIGYAFINFVTHEHALGFKETFTGYSLPTTTYHSPKVCEVDFARIQGLIANVETYRNSPLVGVPIKEYRPLCFRNGVEIPLPTPNAPVPLVQLRVPKGKNVVRVRSDTDKGADPRTDTHAADTHAAADTYRAAAAASSSEVSRAKWRPPSSKKEV